MTEFRKLESARPHFMPGQMALALRDVAGNTLNVSFTPTELTELVAGLLNAAGLMVLTPGMERLRPEDAPPIKPAAFRCLPGSRPGTALFVALLGPVPIAFEMPLSGLTQALDAGMAMG